MAYAVRLPRDPAAPETLEIELQELDQDGRLAQTPEFTSPPYSEVDPHPEANLNALIAETFQPIPARPVANPAAPPPVYPLTQKEYRELRRKIRHKVGYRLLPFVIIFCFLIQLDYEFFTREQPYLEQVLGFTEQQYKGIALTREIGHIIFQVPSNLFLSTTFRPADYLCGVLVAWGIAQWISYFANSLLEAHFFYLTLGMLESAILPGFLYLLSC
ncbi:hypothetical protein F5Y00DRAFT_219611 [Daldinia vernicosa]|uniref:uncharacterized protein n=1 Tax=Daldinia vernicosa TaxID=114800 RepID=UPI002008E4A8|nr:uncharacterized protein F5Y00DRAFT_219611 [Daldinia vernicosa]KAI0843978.1 hypothetical protein F5Y00DRAFT_219611 [Daldinia vernicosa]